MGDVDVTNVDPHHMRLAFARVCSLKTRQSDPVNSGSANHSAKRRRNRGEEGRILAQAASPAEIAARLDAPVLATFGEFGALIRRSARTVKRMEEKGLPVLRPGRTPLVPVERALAWIAAGKPRPRSVGRPRNIDRGRGGNSGGEK